MQRVLMPLLLAALWVAPLSGCKGLSTGAREHFAKKYSCPEDGITLKPRPDVRPADVFVPPWMRDVKPATDEVKRDPVRYAEWKKNRDAEQAHLNDLYSDARVFEVTGCGHTEILGCKHPSDGSGTAEDLVDCMEPDKESLLGR